MSVISCYFHSENNVPKKDSRIPELMKRIMKKKQNSVPKVDSRLDFVSKLM